MAQRALVDAHVQVDPRISVSKGHRIAESAGSRVLKAHAAVLDVLVHIDPEDDLDPDEGARRMPAAPPFWPNSIPCWRAAQTPARRAPLPPGPRRGRGLPGPRQPPSRHRPGGGAADRQPAPGGASLFRRSKPERYSRTKLVH